MADKLVYAYRTANGFCLKRGLNGDDVVERKFDGNVHSCRAMQFSTSGRYFAYCDNEKTFCLDSASGKEKFSHPLQRTIKIAFSPNDNVMVTFEPYVIYGMRTNPDGTKNEPQPNLRFFDVRDGTLLSTLIAQKQSCWKPQFSDDEKFCVVRGPGSELHFYENNKFDRYTRKGVIKGLEGFELSPGLDPLLCCFIPAASGKPGLIQLRSPHDELRVLCQKTSFNCDICTMQWNSKGNAVLATTTVEVDKTNQSYYGVSFVYLLTKTGESFQVQLSKEGPLHSLEWSPNGNNFAASFGFMPAKIAVYNLRATVVWDLGESHKNELHYNPFGNILASCGFGNLSAGKIEMWDVDKRSEVVQMAVPNTTYFSWAPDGQHFVTATTAPRLRVDNNFRVWHYTGELKKEHLCNDETKPVELLQFLFKPAINEFSKFKVVELTEAERKKIANHKLASSVPESPVTRLQKIGIVSTESAYVPPHKRKGNGAAAGTGKVDVEKPRVELTPHEKDVKKLQKKVDDIQKLKKKMADGFTLENNQIEKIAKLPQLEAELAQLLLSNGSS